MLAAGLGLRPLEFIRKTRIHDRNLLVYRDLQASFYFRGLSEQIPTMSRFLEWQQFQREAFTHVRTTYSVGVSSGAYAAICSGYFLRTKIVWAFAPPVTQIDVTRLGSALRLDDTSQRCLDLVQLLAVGNGVTEYRIFYNEMYAPDRTAAERLSGCPGVMLCPQRGDGHLVVSALGQEGQLESIFVPFEE